MIGPTETTAFSTDGGRPTLGGLGVGLVSVSLAASGFRSLRLEIGGLLVHAANVIVAPLLLLAASRIHTLPRRFVLCLAVFCICISTSALIEPRGLGTTVKVLASVGTGLVAATAIRNDADYRIVAIALAMAGAILGIKGLLGGESGRLGINPMEGIANKNAFSLYVLPGLLLGGHVLISPATSKRARLVLAVAIMTIVVAMFSTANRSGWIGSLVVAALLMLGTGINRRLAWALAITIAAGSIVQSFGDPLVLDDRIEATSDPVEAASTRVELVRSALEVGLRNPILGVGPQRLPIEMARLSGIRGDAHDSHNVAALVFGGGGLLSTIPFVLLGFLLWRRPAAIRHGEPAQMDAHYLLRAVLLLWLIRGMFSAEILYSLAFSIGVGACVARCNYLQVWR